MTARPPRLGPLETRFHYNALENSVLRGFARREGLPDPDGHEAWERARLASNLRVLDAGAGRGHWTRFFRHLLHVRSAVAVETSDDLADFLERRFASDPGVRVVRASIAAPDFGPAAIGGRVRYVTAMGVMHHLVDDAAWRRGLANLTACLDDDGTLFVSGAFARRTIDLASPDGGAVRHRHRSLAAWRSAALANGLEIVEHVRTDRDAEIAAPGNDLLVLARAVPRRRDARLRES